MTMRIEQFAMERFQSTWENQVEINLSESGVHPLRLDELVEDPVDREAFWRQQLGYTQTNGTPPLRDAVAALYPGATRDHVEITNGGAEANFISCWHLLDRADEAVVMVPNYMQAWGLARAFAGAVREWPLREEQGVRWRIDPDELGHLVTPRTKLILVCNPNNPTGARLTGAELDEVCRVAARHGAWVLSDEIYRGAELREGETPSMWGRYERVIVTSGLSKAYGLPGLRIGWVVSQPTLVESLWSYHDYTTIAPGALNDRLATMALQPSRRARILARTRSILRANFPILAEWLASHPDAFSYTAPEAGAIAYVQYHKPVNSTRLVTELRERKSVLIVPGDHFGMDGYLRIGYGAEPPQLHEGLNRLHDLLTSLGA
jgi:aspartate/methionine/tyrosine aminotransferase